MVSDRQMPERMKREHGAVPFKRAKSVTAPATVSGERGQYMPLGASWEGWPSYDPRVRRPAIALSPTQGGALWKEALWTHVSHFTQ